MPAENIPFTILSAEFILGSDKLVDLPSSGEAEIALIGRSNAGKSTLLNRMSRRKKLARTSSTPGRTQQINLFKTRLTSPGGEKTCVLADLPGFGFAKSSRERREDLSRLVVDYISERSDLNIVCILNDCRRDPGEDELAVRNLAARCGRHVLVVLTKADKLKRVEREQRASEIAQAYGLEGDDIIVTGDDLPITPLWQRVIALI